MDFLGNMLLELGLLTLMGVLYYFYQKKKILRYEAEKGPVVMGFLLHSILAERGEEGDPTQDTLIEALDDYLHNKTTHPPISLLTIFANSAKCSAELRHVILEGIKEVGDGKE
jgi:hypothetical protein